LPCPSPGHQSDGNDLQRKSATDFFYNFQNRLTCKRA
jgi:hypothetical protein